MIYVAIGANLADIRGASPLQTCRWAVAQLAALERLRVDAVSGWYDTAPVPPSDQPRYVNGAVALAGAIAPARLLGLLQAIEREAGRARGVADAARTLDLDIIDHHGLQRTAPDPVLPHPRAHLRGFVLHPLRDIAPGWVHPGSGETIDALIAALPAADVTLLARE